MLAPFSILLLHFDWTQIPASFTFTIGSQAVVGGTGAIGRGNIQDVMASDGPFGSSSGGSPIPTAKVLQGGVVGTAYSETISAQGGTGPYNFSVTAGSLPTGLSLNASTGVISGTPTTVQTSDFTIKATDANGSTGSTAFEIGVATAGSSGIATNYCIVD